MSLPRSLASDDQLALAIPPSCKYPACRLPVAGSSTTGEGHVCSRHNEREWGLALLRSKYSDHRAMGARLMEDSRA